MAQQQPAVRASGHRTRAAARRKSTWGAGRGVQPRVGFPGPLPDGGRGPTPRPCATHLGLHLGTPLPGHVPLRLLVDDAAGHSHGARGFVSVKRWWGVCAVVCVTSVSERFARMVEAGAAVPGGLQGRGGRCLNPLRMMGNPRRCSHRVPPLPCPSPYPPTTHTAHPQGLTRPPPRLKT